MSRSAARKGLELRKAPPRSPELARRGDLLWIETQYLQPDPSQPRKEFDEESLVELAASLTDVGVLTPLRVRPADPATGMHAITDGERRWRAGQRAGVPLFPCLVEAAEGDRAFFEAYLANLHRDALSPVDAAVGLQHIRESLRLTSDDEVATRLRKSRGWVRQMNAVLGLDPETRALMQERGEPVAIAVGLRPQTPAERRVTLDAIADLPSRDDKVRFISRVNDHRRAGLDIGEAVELVAGGSEESSSQSGELRARPTKTGRAPRVSAPFTWRDGDDGAQVEVAPAALATTRLAIKRTATADEWVEAIRSDLLALGQSSAGEPVSEDAVARYLEPLRRMLDRFPQVPADDDRRAAQ